MAMDFSDQNLKDMVALQAQLAIVLRRANAERLEAGLAAFACVRLARQLLDFYPEDARAALLSAIVPFLQGKSDEEVGLQSKLLIM